MGEELDEALGEVARHYSDAFNSPEALADLARKRLAWRLRRGFKVCSSCSERKPVADFGKDASRRDGLRVQCRECRRV